MKIISHQLSWVIIGAGVLFSLYLVWLIPDDVYFSGDGGLKALLAQQLSSGIWRIDLVPPDIDWVRQLWNQGLYPYEEPFVYHIEDKYYITFPFPFSLVTAPFYALFGYRGLYIIPLVATWFIWLTFYLGCRRLRFDGFTQNLALFGLIFASNLTLYSGMYWEHSLAVSLCFIGMTLLLIPKESANLSFWEAILGGFFVGLSAWVRSEFLAMVVTLAFFVGILTIVNYQPLQNIRDKFKLNSLTFSLNNALGFGVSMFATVGLFFVSNRLVYGNFLGIHALQIVEEFSLARRLKEAWESFQEISIDFFVYFPIALFTVLYLLAVIVNKVSPKNNNKIPILVLAFIAILGSVLIIVIGGLPSLKIFIKTWGILVLLCFVWTYFISKLDLQFQAKMALFYGIGLIFTIGVALLVDSGSDEIAVGGKQWGVRYLLILLPFFSFLAVEQLSLIRKQSQPLIGYFSLFLFSIFLIMGLHKNLYEGTLFFDNTHQGVEPAIEKLRENKNQVIVVSHQYAAQLLESPLGKDKLFFRVDDEKSLRELVKALVNHNQLGFVYVCYPFRKCTIPEIMANNWQLTDGNQEVKIEAKELGKIGKYPMYETKIIVENKTTQ
ncbi:LA_3751/LA_3752 family putative glycosyltransferase [Crocosphaera sp. XPORK-15E]|uniref:LA_3751/LA_3752 family putative glycosyltransferase n=1 Tax=Crocosphaera sp. XPORK-15E TaxID=3110247 RepID=UPI002B205472|nr:dolichol-phosphate mannosyltransferase [Crocosphaera sp. XPORK-15E]MEA5535274.1 dolichol-phosphate mannosyltransferase [Crocosphaera sp. XPORK-15E]